jgi:hypothetical protein
MQAIQQTNRSELLYFTGLFDFWKQSYDPIIQSTEINLQIIKIIKQLHNIWSNNILAAWVEFNRDFITLQLYFFHLV